VKGISTNYFKFIISFRGCLFYYAARSQWKPCYATVYTPVKLHIIAGLCHLVSVSVDSRRKESIAISIAGMAAVGVSRCVAASVAAVLSKPHDRSKRRWLFTIRHSVTSRTTSVAVVT